MKNTIIRNRVFGGKGGLLQPSFFSSSHNVFKLKWVKCLTVLLVALFLNSTISPNIALARSSGGGDLGEFETDKFALSVGISLVSYGIGSVIGSGISSACTSTGSFAGGAAQGISNLGNLGTWASNYGTVAAMTQIGTAVSTYGNYKEWDESRTILVSSIAQGVAGGVMNPTSTLGLDAGTDITAGVLGRSVAMGTLTGATSGGVTAALAHQNGEENENTGAMEDGYEPWMGFVGGMAGNLVGGIAGSTAWGNNKGSESGDYIGRGFNNMGTSLASGAISMGKEYIKDGMDAGDKYLVDAGFQGAYPIVGAYWQKAVYPDAVAGIKNLYRDQDNQITYIHSDSYLTRDVPEDEQPAVLTSTQKATLRAQVILKDANIQLTSQEQVFGALQNVLEIDSATLGQALQHNNLSSINPEDLQYIRDTSKVSPTDFQKALGQVNAIGARMSTTPGMSEFE